MVNNSAKREIKDIEWEATSSERGNAILYSLGSKNERTDRSGGGVHGASRVVEPA